MAIDQINGPDSLSETDAEDEVKAVCHGKVSGNYDGRRAWQFVIALIEFAL